MNNGDSILVLASSSTGNNVFMSPAIKLLRKKLPDSIIEVVALSKLSAEVFSASPYINKLHMIKKASVFDKLAAKFDYVIPLHQNSIKKYHSIKTKIHPTPMMVDSLHHADQLLNHVANLLNTLVTDDDRQYHLGKPSKNFVTQKTVYEKEPVINIHLGSGKSNLHGWKFWHRSKAEEPKIWNIDNYINLVEKLLKFYPDLIVTLTGSLNESYLANYFVKKIPHAINLTGKTTVHDLLNHINHCDLFVSHDCGILHVASATSTPIVALFGPTNPIRYGPYPNNKNRIVIKRKCMSDINVDDVIDAINGLLLFSNKD